MPWSYRPALDGLRTVAVYLVVLFHAGLASAGGGFIGVDLFFVLSGFLVSNVILSELDRTGRLDLGRFYARRVRRLLPAAVVVIVATAGVFLLVAPLARRLSLVGDAQSALLYVANWNFLFQQEDYFATNVDESPFLHFWSLAIEEQFYLFFPLLLVLLFRRSGGRGRLLPAVVGALFALSLASQLFWGRVNQTWAYYGTDARLYQLLAGVVLALALRAVVVRPSPRTAGVGATVGLLAMLVLGSGLLEMSPSWRGILATAASVVLVGGLMLGEDGLVARLLSRPTPVFLGKVSYGTYLWHWPVILVLQEVLAVGPATVVLLAVGLSTALAALSYQVLEAPIRSARTLHPFRWQTALVGLTVSALVAVAVVPQILSSERTPRLASRMVVSQPAASEVPQEAPPTLSAAEARPTAPEPSRKERQARVPSDIDYERLLETHPGFPRCTPEDPDACVLVEGDGPHIALVGDSHAEMLGEMFKKLAREHDLTLSVNAVRGCPWQAGLVDDDMAADAAEECSQQRAQWYDDVLPQLDPDLVVLVARPRDQNGRWRGRLLREEGPTEDDVRDLVFNTTAETLDLLEDQGRRVLMLESLPIAYGEDPLECLSGAQRLSECTVPLRRAPVSDAFFKALASLSDARRYASVTDIFCVGAPDCLPVIDGKVVWVDSSHMSTDITLHLRDQVWQRIEETGILRGL